jgi:hypothetical protein
MPDDDLRSPHENGEDDQVNAREYFDHVFEKSEYRKDRIARISLILTFLLVGFAIVGLIISVLLLVPSRGAVVQPSGWGLAVGSLGALGAAIGNLLLSRSAASESKNLGKMLQDEASITKDRESEARNGE